MAENAGTILNRQQRMAVVASFATMFTLGFTISLLGPSLPGLAQRSGVTVAQAGILFTLFGAGSLLATLLVAGWMDRPVRHFLLVAGAVLLAIALWLATRFADLALLGVAFALAGLGMSTMGVAPNAIIAGFYGDRSSGVFNLLHMCSGVGSFLGPLAVGAAIRMSGSYAGAFRAISVVALVLAVLWAVGSPPLPRGGGQSLRSFRGVLTLPLLVLVLLTLVYVGSEQAFGGWIFNYARTVVQADVTSASFAASLFWLAVMAGRLGAARILRQRSNLTVMASGIALAGCGIGLVLLATTARPCLWAGIALVGLGFGPVFPTAMAAGTQATPGRAGLVSSLLVAAGSGGSMVLPWAAGALISWLGALGSMASAELGILAMLACLGTAGRLASRTDSAALPHP